MCGITGFLGHPRSQDAKSTLRAMSAALAHRGPDDEGSWIDGPIALGQRRLAIIDLSPAGHQPMVSASGRFILVLNGEIYNHVALRKRIDESAEAPVAWRGHSDTEVVLAAVERWGLVGALERLEGMFALALWDSHERTLTLARDRLGEKPLCYAHIGDTFAFASELRALKAFPGFEPTIDRRAVAAYFELACVPAPLSIYEGAFKLPPACYLVVREGATAGDLRPVPYWSAERAAREGAASPFASEAEATDRLDAALREVVRECMTSDVPLGVFLSGGIDSSTVAALAQAESGAPVRTFSIGFRERTHDEAGAARAVAAHLGTRHTELYATAEDALALVQEMAAIYDEPFADESQLPTYLVARLARAHVTVAITGDGGDEVFAGYPRYLQGLALWRASRRLPATGRRALARALRALPPERWNRLSRPFRRVLQRRVRDGALGAWVHRAADALGSRDLAGFHASISSTWDPAERLVLGADGTQLPRALAEGLDPLTQMMLLDQTRYLPDDALTKVDRASMAVGLETRAPLLDRRIVELAWRIPPGSRIANGEGKRILRNVLHRYVPRELVDRPKQGFSMPIDDWLRGPLRELAERAFDADRIRKEGYLDADVVARAWREHLAGKRENGQRLWAVLMFQLWLEKPPVRS